MNLSKISTSRVFEPRIEEMIETRIRTQRVWNESIGGHEGLTFPQTSALTNLYHMKEVKNERERVQESLEELLQSLIAIT